MAKSLLTVLIILTGGLLTGVFSLITLALTINSPTTTPSQNTLSNSINVVSLPQIKAVEVKKVCEAKELSRACGECKRAVVVYQNSDCTQNTVGRDDLSCTSKCPVAPPPPHAFNAPSIGTSCCKVCSTGQACGDSCISRRYTCHKAPGCACNG